MSWSIHHVSHEAKDVRRSAAFLAVALGMAEGQWVFHESRGYIPAASDRPVPFPDSRQSHTGLDLTRDDPAFVVRNGFRHNPSLGGHFAIDVADLKAEMLRLHDAGIPYSDGEMFAIPNLHNIYLEDPDGNLIEVNQRVLRRPIDQRQALRVAPRRRKRALPASEGAPRRCGCLPR